MTKIVVTGGAGFVGSHLCDWLLRDQSIEQVKCFDNLQTGNKTNIFHLQQKNRFEFVEGDVIDKMATEKVASDVNQIWNLACAASPPKYQSDPIHTFMTSVMGVANLATLASTYGARFFHASTSEVYGDPTVSPQPEAYWGNVNPVGIRSCYDEGKRAAETLIFDMNRVQGLDARVVRIFNTYGPRMAPDDGRVVSNFIMQALTGEDITIYGDGKQTRSFCYVDDLIEIFIRFMNDENYGPGPLNTGNPCEFTMLELAEKVITLTGTKSKIVFRDLPKDDPRQRRPDITNAIKNFNWEPKVQLDDGLRETISYFRSVLAG